jgi:CheY-like chemotaxis protein
MHGSNNAPKLAEVIPLRSKMMTGCRGSHAAGNPSPRHPQRILVVDDDDIHRQIVCAQLRKLGRAAHESTNGEEAIAAVMKETYDIIFMDLGLPGMNGIEASRWISERFNDDGGLRIIALTGNTTIEARMKCQRAGMDDFIAKPAQLEDLEAVLGLASHNLSGFHIRTHPCPPQLISVT